MPIAASQLAALPLSQKSDHVLALHPLEPFIIIHRESSASIAAFAIEFSRATISLHSISF